MISIRNYIEYPILINNSNYSYVLWQIKITLLDRRVNRNHGLNVTNKNVAGGQRGGWWRRRAGGPRPFADFYHGRNLQKRVCVRQITSSRPSVISDVKRLGYLCSPYFQVRCTTLRSRLMGP